MTRKDYKIIAESIRKSSEYFAETYKNDEMRDILIAIGISNVILNLQMALKEDNPNFKSDVFYKACRL